MTPSSSQRGVALLMVLWIFMVLTVLVGEFSRGMRDDAIATQHMAEEVQAQGVAMAAIGQALYKTLREYEHPTNDNVIDDEEKEEKWLPDGSWHEGTYAGAKYRIRMIDEGGKIPLNTREEAALRRVFESLGLETDEQDALVDAILDWRDKDSLKRLHGAEEDEYRGMPGAIPPKNDKFESVDELLAVRGMTRELFFGVAPPDMKRDRRPPVPLRDVFSVFNLTDNINIRYAPEAVLRVLLAGDDGEDVEEQVEEVIAARETDSGSALALMRAKVGEPLARHLVDRQARFIAVDARALMGFGQIEARVGAVVKMEEDGEGFHVERWFDRLPIS